MNIFSFQKADISKKTLSLLEQGTDVVVPLCPDYIPGGVGDGVSSLMRTATQVASEVATAFPKTTFIFLIANTESDIIDLNQENILKSKESLAGDLSRQLLSSFVEVFLSRFPGWHERQYALEEQIQKNLLVDETLEYFLSLHSQKRKERYSEQYGKSFSLEETRAMQIRHYAQYMLLRVLMEEQGPHILLNYQTENLRAVTTFHSFCPYKQKPNVIVY